MGPRAVVEAEMAADGRSGFGDAGIGAQTDFLVFDRPPEPLDEDVVAPGAFAVHADGDLGILQNLREVDAGELRSLVGIEDFRLAVAAERFLQGLDARQSADSVIDSRQLGTLRLNQSMTAAR